MEIVHPSVDRYLCELASDRNDPTLVDMERLARERSFPIVGPAVGRLLYVLARAIGARRVFELGSGFGYSALWFARAVGAEGRVVLTEGDPARADEAARHLGRAGLLSRVRIEVGDALEIAARTGPGFDIVFNDVDKERYPEIVEPARNLLRPGGLLISDNMLWRGSVIDAATSDPETDGVRELTRLLHGADDFESAWVPLRDGVSVSVYRGRQ